MKIHLRCDASPTCKTAPNGPTSRCTDTEECATPDPAWVLEMQDYATRFAAATSAYAGSQYPVDQVASLQAEYQSLTGSPLTFVGTASEYYGRLCATGAAGPVTTAMSAVLTQMAAASASNRSRGVSKPFRHCLPHKIDDCFNSATPGMCWENPRDRKPQYGCAGLRIRLSCEPDQVIASKNSIRQAKPQVVE